MTIDPGTAGGIVILLLFLWFSGLWKGIAAIFLVFLAITVFILWLGHIGLGSAMQREPKQYKLAMPDAFRVIKDFFELSHVGTAWWRFHKVDPDAGFIHVSLAFLGEQSKGPNQFVVSIQLKSIDGMTMVEQHWEAQYHYVDVGQCTDIANKVHDDLDVALQKATAATEVERKRDALNNEIQRLENLLNQEEGRLAQIQRDEKTVAVLRGNNDNLSRTIQQLKDAL